MSALLSVIDTRAHAFPRMNQRHIFLDQRRWKNAYKDRVELLHSFCYSINCQWQGVISGAVMGSPYDASYRTPVDFFPPRRLCCYLVARLNALCLVARYHAKEKRDKLAFIAEDFTKTIKIHNRMRGKYAFCGTPKALGRRFYWLFFFSPPIVHF